MFTFCICSTSRVKTCNLKSPLTNLIHNVLKKQVYYRIKEKSSLIVHICCLVCGLEGCWVPPVFRKQRKEANGTFLTAFLPHFAISEENVCLIFMHRRPNTCLLKKLFQCKAKCEKFGMICPHPFHCL